MKKRFATIAASGFLTISTLLLVAPVQAQPIPVVLDQVTFHGRLYCFYTDGWSGPGWYWCGYAFRRGFGYGGPDGWRGFRHGHGVQGGFRFGHGGMGFGKRHGGAPHNGGGGRGHGGGHTGGHGGLHGGRVHGGGGHGSGHGGGAHHGGGHSGGGHGGSGHHH